VLLAALVACHRGPKLPEGDVVQEISSAKPASARALDLAALHTKPALVLFVSPTCRYCLATLPRAAAAAQARGAGIVAVFISGSPDNARGVLDSVHFPGTGVVDDGTLVHRYHISAVPYTLVLGSDGQARDVFEGEQEQSTLENALARL
jgi:thioredoxin-like negative regulator of GroEL